MTYRLVYYSSSRLGGSEADVILALWQIVKASRRENAKVGVTGALMFYSETFVQALEGPRDVVKQLFRRIHADQRHTDVSIVSLGNVARPLFSKWSMAAVGTSREQQLTCNIVLGAKTYNPEIMTGAELLESLCYLVGETDAAAAA